MTVRRRIRRCSKSSRRSCRKSCRSAPTTRARSSSNSRSRRRRRSNRRNERSSKGAQRCAPFLFERASHYVSAADGNKFNFDEGEPSSTNRAAHVNARSRNILRLQGTFPGKLLLYRWGISGEYMRKSFLISTAVVALSAAAGLANAQAPGASGSQSAPATMNRSDVPGAKAKQDDAKDGVKSKAVESRPVDKAVETKPDKAVGKPAAEM